MTALYMDTNVGCGDTYVRWTAADEKKRGIVTRIMSLFH